MYCRSTGHATTQGSKTFLSLGKKERREPTFVPRYFFREGSTRIFRRSLTVPVFRHGKNDFAYRTGLEACAPDMMESFKDSYLNITAGALKVHLGHFFFKLLKR
jgi:hypothetical protein